MGRFQLNMDADAGADSHHLMVLKRITVCGVDSLSDTKGTKYILESGVRLSTSKLARGSVEVKQFL